MRPFSLADFIPPNENNPNGSLMFVIHAIGRGTNILRRLPKGTLLTVIGPVGAGFPPVSEGETLIIVAGGIGIASVFGLIFKYPGVPLFYGVRTKELMIDSGLLNYPQDKLHIASDDGSVGDEGSVLDLLERYLERDGAIHSGGRLKIYACGPHSMYKAMAKMALDADVYVSLETPMACGVGTCLGCAVETVGGLQMVCKDGPVFNLKDILLDG